MQHTKPHPPNLERSALIRDKNFVRLMAGSIISMLGDQFTLVALPWLVLRMTGDTLVRPPRGFPACGWIVCGSFCSCCPGG